MKKQDNIKKAKDALRMIERNENPLDNYELVKAALKESEGAIEIIWSELSGNMIEELKKDKEIGKLIADYKKKLEGELKELGKESVTYKFTNADDYEKWKAKAKDTILTRRTEFDIEYIWPVMEDMIDKLFFALSEKSDIADFGKGEKTQAFRISDLPDKNALARQITGNLSNLIEFHVKNEVKKRK